MCTLWSQVNKDIRFGQTTSFFKRSDHYTLFSLCLSSILATYAKMCLLTLISKFYCIIAQVFSHFGLWDKISTSTLILRFKLYLYQWRINKNYRCRNIFRPFSYFTSKLRKFQKIKPRITDVLNLRYAIGDINASKDIQKSCFDNTWGNTKIWVKSRTLFRWKNKSRSPSYI